MVDTEIVVVEIKIKVIIGIYIDRSIIISNYTAVDRSKDMDRDK